ncbi:MAG: lysophospholipase [Rhodoferax sp.]|nr:lysophospholipase [Rhodoferax sp.]
MTAAHQSEITTPHGATLALRDWPLADVAAPRGLVIIVHGLGEHSGRYEAVAQQLNDWGFAVRAFDLCGHGLSSGAPGSLPDEHRLLDDLATVFDRSRAAVAPGLPIVLLGHSLGGLIAARFVSLKLRAVDALVLSSPALDPGLNAFQKLLLATLPKIAPNLRVGNGLDANFLSHDAAVVAAYRADPLVHDRICARLALFIATAGAQTCALASQWTVPTLLMYAGQDRLVNPAGSRAFAAQAPASVLTSQCFDDLYHEIFNESDPAPVLSALQQWLALRYAA